MHDNPAPMEAHGSSGPDASRPNRKGVIGGSAGEGFVIFALPRSRTAWLSHFLSYGDWHCAHEEVRHLRSFGDVDAWFAQPCTGTIETAAASWWRMLPKGVRVATIRRPVAEVVDSLMRIPGCAFDRDELRAVLERHDRKLDQIEARLPGVLSVRFEDLTREETCAALFEHCLPYTHDTGRWAALAPVNIQIDMRALIRYCQAYTPALDKLAAQARHRSMTALALRRPVDADGISFQIEVFDDWLADAQHLLAEHHAQIGEAPGNWQNKNIPLLRQIQQAGGMQIMTARSNGRMFGYLMTLIAPSLAKAGITTAINTAFFADPQLPGLGLKLQREALRNFREQGINEVFWETNTVGGGNRIGSIYKRLGAEEKGSVYRLKLAEAA
jgi:hypothetical protein